MPKKIPLAKAEAPPTRLWDMNVVAQQTTLSKSQIFNLVKEGSFPKPFRVSAGRNAWLAAEVDAWIDARIATKARA